MPPLKTKDILNVQIAHTGTFKASTGPVTFTRRDFDNMESASKDLIGKVNFPLKLGHNDGQELIQEDGLPAAGWIENVRRQGDLLIADFMRVPLQIADIMKAGGFRERSIEAFRNVEFAGKRYPMVLTGTALLGEDLPAVDSLDDIEALYQAAKLELPDHDDAEAELILMVVGVETEAETLIISDKNVGGPDMDGLELSRHSVVKALGLADDASDDDMLAAIAKLKKTQATLDEAEAATKLAADADAAAKAKGDQDKDSPMQKIIDAQSARILTLENNNAKDAATLLADTAIKAGKFVPATRDGLVKLALSNSEEFKKLVSDTPANAVMATGVIGGGGDDDAVELSEFEPDATQLIFMDQTTVTHDEYVLQAMEDSEKPVSEEVKAKLRGQIKASRAAA